MSLTRKRQHSNRRSPAPVHEFGHQAVGLSGGQAFDLFQQLLHFAHRQDERDALWSAGADRIQLADLLALHVAVKEQQGAERLVLRAGRNMPVDCQVGEKGFHLGCAQGAGVAHAVEADVARDPVGVGFLSADGEMFCAGKLRNLYEQFHDVPLRWLGLHAQTRAI